MPDYGPHANAHIADLTANLAAVTAERDDWHKTWQGAHLHRTELQNLLAAAEAERDDALREVGRLRGALGDIALANAPNADWGSEFRDYDGLTVASTLAAIAKATLQESE